MYILPLIAAVVAVLNLAYGCYGDGAVAMVMMLMLALTLGHPNPCHYEFASVSMCEVLPLKEQLNNPACTWKKLMEF